ncbi:MAG: dihydropyrimidinase, partial [Candidatus Heimdallarchaeota archaeon]|nr:dihydropyrimidinase [Candidatus Heimdallarchaeota archaeon]
DADLVIWDPKEERVIKDVDMHSQAGFSMYDGEKHVGWPQIVIRRGEIVFKDRKIVAEVGSGQVVTRGPTQSLK